MAQHSKAINKILEINRQRWKAGSEQWAKRADSRGLWQRCPTGPELVLSDKELEYRRDIQEKHVCVLGSGDNQVVFAMTGQGGIVTSVDISRNQLDNLGGNHSARDSLFKITR